MTERGLTLEALGEVLRSADLLSEMIGAGDVSVRGVAQDSRRVAEGDLFLAWRGFEVDAHDFVTEAARRGAVATVVEHAVDTEIPQLVVTNGRRAAEAAWHSRDADAGPRYWSCQSEPAIQS